MNSPDKATVELLPCPFCGSAVTIRVAYEGDDDYAQLRCDKCLAMGPLKDEIGDWQRPYKSWNTRALPTPTDASGLVEALEFYGSRNNYRDDGFDYPTLLDRGDKARQALAQHREGKQWSDETLAHWPEWKRKIFYDMVAEFEAKKSASTPPTEGS